MHGGHLVEERRLHKLQARLEQLGPDHHCHGTARDEHREREHQVHGADILVVGGKQPPSNALGGAVIVVISGVSVCDRTHDEPPLLKR